MKLRRLKILAVMLLIGISAIILEATVRTGTYSRVRPAGSATSSAGNLNFAVDSGQTLWVDTFLGCSPGTIVSVLLKLLRGVQRWLHSRSRPRLCLILPTP